MPSKADGGTHKGEVSPSPRAAQPATNGFMAPLAPVSLDRLLRTLAVPQRAAPADILGLQRVAGNRAVSHLIQATRAPTPPAAQAPLPFPLVQPPAISSAPPGVIRRKTSDFVLSSGKLNKDLTPALGKGDATWADILKKVDRYWCTSDICFDAREQRLIELEAQCAKWNTDNEAKTDAARGKEATSGAQLTPGEAEIIRQYRAIGDLKSLIDEEHVEVRGDKRQWGEPVHLGKTAETRPTPWAETFLSRSKVSANASVKNLDNPQNSFPVVMNKLVWLLDPSTVAKLHPTQVVPATTGGQAQPNVLPRPTPEDDWALIQVDSDPPGKYAPRRGWIEKTKLADTGEHGYARNEDVSYIAQSAPLFSAPDGLPHVQDIRQGGLGDCYLLAALTSIVNKSPQRIKQAMQEHYDGTVTVRFYDVDTSFRNPAHRYKERYVTIKKVVPKYKVGGEDPYAQGSLWVQIFEKAYAAAGFKGGELVPQTFTSAALSYANIRSGRSAHALEQILGQAAEEQTIQSPDTDWLEVPDQVFGGTVPQDWFEFQCEQQKNYMAPAFDAVRGHAAWCTDIDNYLKGKVQDATRDLVVDWLRAKHQFAGKRGTGTYTPYQLELYDKIKQALGSNQYVVLGSRADMGSSTQRTGQSGNEPTAKGLVGLHGYAVLAADWSDTKDKHPAESSQHTGNPPADALRWIKVRNPWGYYGRKYKRDGSRLRAGKDPDRQLHREQKNQGRPEDAATKLQRDEKEAAFWLELGDVTKRFESLHRTKGGP